MTDNDSDDAPLVRRDEQGRVLAGYTANPHGRARRQLGPLVRKLTRNGRELVELLLEVARESSENAADRVRAIRTLLEYSYEPPRAPGKGIREAENEFHVEGDEAFTEYLNTLTESDYERFAASGMRLADVYREFKAGPASRPEQVVDAEVSPVEPGTGG